MLVIYIATYAIRMPAATSIIRATVSWDTDTLLLLSNKVPCGDTGNNERHRAVGTVTPGVVKTNA